MTFSAHTGFVWRIALIAAIGGLLFGYDTGIIASTFVFIRLDYEPTLFVGELIVSSVVLGAFFSALFTGGLANSFGRRNMLLIAATIAIVGTILSSAARGPAEVILGRFILGLAIGISSYTVPLYISEIAPKETRGALVLINGVAITGGQAFAFWVGYSLVDLQSWRLLFLTCLVPATALWIGLWFVPATPRWLMMKGGLKETVEVLKKTQPRANVMREFKEIKRHLGNTRGLFREKHRRVLLLGLGLGVLQQFSGVNAVLYYGPIIFEQFGYEAIRSQFLATFGLGVVNCFFSLTALLIVDRVGRKQLLLFASLLSAASLFILGLQPAPILAVFLMFTYMAGVALGIGSLFWLIISEIYPLNVRASAMSFVTSIQWGANFLVASTFLSLINAWGVSTVFWLFSGMNLLCFLFALRFLFETKQMPLEVIGEKN